MLTRTYLLPCSTLALSLVAAPELRAAPPAAENFNVTYYLTDADGSRSRQLTDQDMTGFFGRARCECGQAIDARIALAGTAGVDDVVLNAQVGSQCDIGEDPNNSQSLPCAELSQESYCSEWRFPSKMPDAWPAVLTAQPIV